MILSTHTCIACFFYSNYFFYKTKKKETKKKETKTRRQTKNTRERMQVQQPENLYKNFVLYHHTTPACQRILKLNESTKIKTVRIVDKNYPAFLVGVPSLCDFKSKTVFQGKDAFKVLNAIKQEVQKLNQQQQQQQQQQEKQEKQEAKGFQSVSRPVKSSLISVPNMKITESIISTSKKITEDDIDMIMQQREEILKNIKQRN